MNSTLKIRYPDRRFRWQGLGGRPEQKFDVLVPMTAHCAAHPAPRPALPVAVNQVVLLDGNEVSRKMSQQYYFTQHHSALAYIYSSSTNEGVPANTKLRYNRMCHGTIGRLAYCRGAHRELLLACLDFGPF